jgi:hypothetical protein
MFLIRDIVSSDWTECTHFCTGKKEVNDLSAKEFGAVLVFSPRKGVL